MRKIIILIIASLICFSSCEKNKKQDVFSNVKITLKMPDYRHIKFMNVDMSVKGNFFQNLNTLQKYDFPIFTDGTAYLEVLKGVYIISFDATARFSDGSTGKIRAAEHNSPDKAVNLLKEKEEIELILIALD